MLASGTLDEDVQRDEDNFQEGSKAVKNVVCISSIGTGIVLR